MLSQISPVIRITDNASQNLSTDFLSGGKSARDAGTEATLAHQFVDQNAAIFQRFGISAGVEFDGRNVAISLSTSNDIGAFPLRSPTTGSYEYGMLIRPRFEWDGLGTMLGTMGWKVIPSLQDLPVLPRSAREIPRWVMSSVILSRIENLLSCIERRFELVQTDREAPKGQVNWTVYATEKIPRMKFMEVPCLFPDLRDDRLLLAAVHFALRQQLSDLQSQRSAGIVVRTLIDKCEQLLSGVRRYPARQPTPRMLESWYSGSLKHPKLVQGVEAMEWSIENRGLAGLSSLRGMPWKMNMPEFFECWVENLAEHLCRLTGGRMRSGRKGETVIPISWESSAAASQKSLIPDIVIDRPGETIIIDAKYKAHWHELNMHRWHELTENIRESHRHDLLQVLAYSTLFTSPKITACLLYPCWPKTWEKLRASGHLQARASVYSGTREVNILLSVVPMSAAWGDVVESIREAI